MLQRTVKSMSALAGFVAGLFGRWPAALNILLALMAIDYLTGVLAALAGRSAKTDGGGLSSAAGFAGLAKKGFVMLIVLVATLLDRAVGNTAMVFQLATTFYYIANEGLSILENAERMGVPFPAFIRDKMESMKEKSPDQ